MRKIISVLTSEKSCECRIPIAPQHVEKIKSGSRDLFFETGYAKDCSYPSSIDKFSFLPRDILLSISDIVLLLKPLEDDLGKMKEGATLIGWCHCIQRPKLVKIAVEKKLTLISMENMFFLNQENEKEHYFRYNNFMAGFLGIKHALSVVPYSYSDNTKVSVICYGASSEGSVKALVEMGFSNIIVFSRRKMEYIKNKIDGVEYRNFFQKNGKVFSESGNAFEVELLKSDIIINGIMQDVISPVEFITEKALAREKNKFIIDISCDEKMGFSFAQPTSLMNPIINIGHNFYYAVDNIPTLRWEMISNYLSKQLIPILNSFLSDSFDINMVTMLEKAVDIKLGSVVNPIISEYQNLSQEVAT